jgi:hypothetical protein
MVRRFVAGFAVAAALAVPARAADVPFTVLLDGRPLTSHSTGTGALARNGLVYIDVVVATKTFSGLLTFADGGQSVRMSFRGHTALFHVGNRVATFDGKRRVMAGAPFKQNGDIYVSLPTIAKLGGAGLTIDYKHRVAHLDERPFATMIPPAPTPGPAQTASAAVLTLTPNAMVDASGALHAHLDVVNATGSPVKLEFPNGSRVAFIVTHGDTIVWDSTRGKLFPMIVGFVTVPPHGKISFDETWPEYAAQPAGSYMLTARLMLRSPIVSSPVAVPAAAPHPAVS